MNKAIIVIILIIVVAIAGALILRGRNNGQTAVSPTASGQAALTPQQSAASASQAQIGADIGDLAPDFELTDFNGNKVKLSDFRGKSPVFINFWASWCPFCVQELPLMSKIQQEFAGKYVTLAVNRGESQSTGQSFISEVGIAGKLTFLNDPSDSIYAKYGGFSMPYSLFIDKNGIIQDNRLGPLTESEFKDKLSKIIK